MSRTKLFVIFVLLIVLGFVLGWFLQQWWDGAVEQSPVSLTSTGATLGKTKSKAGFCCMEIDQACVAVENPGECFRNGGEAFNASQRNCDFYCLGPNKVQ